MRGDGARGLRWPRRRAVRAPVPRPAPPSRSEPRPRTGAPGSVAWPRRRGESGLLAVPSSAPLLLVASGEGGGIDGASPLAGSVPHSRSWRTQHPT